MRVIKGGVILSSEKRSQDLIHQKGFDIYRNSSYAYDVPSEYRKIKIGVKNLEDAILNLGSYKTEMPRHLHISKPAIYKALAENDLCELRRISNHYYNVSGIYSRVCNYFAFLYRYDWYVAPEIYDDSIKEEKVLKDFSKMLDYLDNSYLKKKFGEIALSVIKNGCYYGYIVPSSKGLVLQPLPVDFCRSRFFVEDNPAVEFNMKFFDTFKDISYRMRVLKLFPEEFQKGYVLYKQGKLISTEYGDCEGGWYLLDPANTVKFNFNGSDVPLFVNSIPSILDLDAAQDLDRRKQM